MYTCTGLLMSAGLPSGLGNWAGTSAAAAGKTRAAITTAAKAKTAPLRVLVILVRFTIRLLS
jgi:hypothetical protein